MKSKEIGDIPENIDREPSIMIRPHHLMLFMPGRFRIFRVHSPIKIALELALTFKHLGENSQYQLDALGIYGTPEHEKSEQAGKSIEQDLRNLPNDALVRLDLSKDSICNSCPIGKHCTATNYKSHGRKRNYQEIEEKLLESVRRKLLKKGFLEDVDFKLIPTVQTLLDYQGENLWTSDKTPIPIAVEYSAMLVKMGALRKIV